jgi:hypothetical protein
MEMGEMTSRQQRRFEYRKGERRVGFTAVPGRVNRGVQVQIAYLVTLGVSAVEAEQQAWAEVRKSLPPAPMVRSYARKPSKNDNPAYRKSIWPEAKIARRTV